MLTFHRFSGLVAAGAVLAVGAFLIGVATSERTIHNAFATALEQRSSTGSGDAMAGGFDPAYLRQASLPASGLGAVREAVHVGDRIAWSARTGDAQTYEVISVQPLRGAEPGVLGGGGELVLVTAAAVGGGAGPKLRFVVEVKPELPAAVAYPITPRAL